MTKVKLLSAEDFRRLISAAKHHPQMLRTLLFHSMAAPRCSAPLPLLWERGDASKPRAGARQRRKRGDV
jgi:hypothetical protein